jgi:hypothetical protein
MRKIRNTHTILSKNCRGKDHFKNLSVEGRIILKWILKGYSLRVWAQSS